MNCHMTVMETASGSTKLRNKYAICPQKQRFQRYTIRLMSLISSNGKHYAGFVHNVSEEGLAFEAYAFAPIFKELLPCKTVNLIVKMPSGEILNLTCEIIWSSEHSPLPWPLIQNYKTLIMGMRIIDPPATYREYVKTMQ